MKLEKIKTLISPLKPFEYIIKPLVSQREFDVGCKQSIQSSILMKVTWTVS